ncbi:MOSC domain-containing protein [Zhongshania sp. BJYM1]|jgi:MOSC domain-containing protein YiiM|uniref:MOSC domain-containing protein n=1 Tax=Zhongshania aquatica TaxID=2965069 RepID=UPI0022B2F393|nr:MOSC domain-containing protein [Marortus sp. BJYM1]
MNAQGRLIARFLDNLPPGKLEWIGLRPARKEPMVSVAKTIAIADRGLQGDRRLEGSKGSARQVSIISVEFIRAIADNLGIDNIPANILRRNLLVSGVNLNALRHQYFQIGSAVFQATAQCHPCSRMEAALGKGGLVAMLGYGGLCAKIVESGEIKCGDELVYMPPNSYQERQLSLY